MLKAPKALSIRHLDKSYPLGRQGKRINVVRDFNLDLTPGEFVTLLGPSGCGKTTVLRTLAGLEAFEKGEILLDLQSISHLPAYRRQVGFVFQNYALFPHLSVFSNVAYPLYLQKQPTDLVEQEVAAALASVGLEGYGNRMPGQLSGGQQQRVAVARALVMKPDLLLFDEPLSNLDAKLRVQVRSELRRLQKQLGTTALFVTHDQDEAMSLSDRIAVMKEGQIEQIGTPEDIYARPASLFVAQFVGKVNAIAATIIDAPHGRYKIAMLGAEFDAASANNIHDRQVLALIRPEAIALTAASQGIRGTIVDREFLGSHTEYQVATKEAHLVVICPAHPGQPVYQLGDHVGALLAEEAIHLLPAVQSQ